MKIKRLLLLYSFLALLLIFLPPAALPSPEDAKIKVVGDLANVRQEPDIGSLILRQFPRGAVLDAILQEGEWFKIRFELNPGELSEGYVHESLVEVVEGTVPESLPPEKKEVEEISPPVKTTPAKKTPAPVKTTPATKDIFSPVPDSAGSRIALTLAGGGLFANVGDLNDGVRGLTEFYRDTLGVQGHGAVSDLKLAYLFGAEVFFLANPRLCVLFGVDFFQGDKESRVDFSTGPGVSVFTGSPRIQAVPLRLSLAYFPVPWAYVKVGGEIILAKCFYSYRFAQGDTWQSWEGNARAQGYGAVTGIGILLNLNSRWALLLDVTGRLAKIGGFEGSDHFSDSNGAAHTEEGKLYIYQGQTSGNNTYSLLFIRERIPSEAGVFSPREARINLSGVSMKIGVRIRF